MSVEIVHWNPRRKTGRLRLPRLANNFGDLLGPLITERLVRDAGYPLHDERPQGGPRRRLLTVGSILQFAMDGDVVWGTGANGKTLDVPFLFERIDVRAVRGPRTRALLQGMGVPVPEIYGDPGLLVGRLWDRDSLARRGTRRSYAVVPNFRDYRTTPKGKHIVNPRAPVQNVIGNIAAADLVVGSSLHGIVVAESLGIPARLVRSAHEPMFKYADYYEGTGRPHFQPADTVEEALALGGEPAPVWDPQPLIDAFPIDLWSGSADRSGTDGSSA